MAKMVKKEEKEKIRILQTGNRDGFSLLELLVVLFLIGLILALSFPDLRVLYEKHKFDSEVGKIKKLLFHTYILSLNTGKVCTVSLSNGEIAYPDGTYSIPQGLDIEGDKEISFYPDGRTSGGRWKIEEDGYKKAIVVKMFTREIEVMDLP